MSADIVQGTPQATALQDAIQADLIHRGYSTEGDNVMAEFVFVMLCNKKNAEQITAELQDLIGPDFDAAFTSWLFDTVAIHYPPAKPVAQPLPAKPVQQPPVPTQTSTGRPSPFGNVAAGIKRPLNDGSGSNSPNPSNGPPSQRMRTEGSSAFPENVPRGPRNPLPSDGDPNAGPPSNKRLSERMGPPPGMSLVMTPMGPAYVNPQTQQFTPAPPEAMEQFANGHQGHQGGQRGQRGGRGRGRRDGRDRDNHQQQQQPPMMFPPGPGMPMMFAPGPNGQPQFFPQQPQFFPFQQPGQPFPQDPSMMMQQQHQQQQQQQQPLPSKPSDEGLCKYATECKNAYCKFAHPSPAATKESGLVLSSEACEKQLSCEDADCPKSHVSPQQKDPASSRPPPASEQVAQPFPMMRPNPMMNPYAAPPGGQKPCKFGANCTRPDCMFQHPWNNPTPCKFGAGCTRPDCYFSHPPGHFRNKRGGGGGGGRGNYANKGNRTAVFNQESNNKSVEEKLKETEAEKSNLSERMKRFNPTDSGTDKVIPGQSTEGAGAASTEQAPATGQGEAAGPPAEAPAAA